MTTEARRTSDPVLAEVLQMVTEVNNILKSHMHDHDMNHQALETQLTEMHNEVKVVANGFPDQNPEWHRIWHEAEMKRIKDRAEFWKKMTFELGKYGLLGFAGWAAYVLWKALLMGPK